MSSDLMVSLFLGADVRRRHGSLLDLAKKVEGAGEGGPNSSMVPGGSRVEKEIRFDIRFAFAASPRIGKLSFIAPATLLKHVSGGTFLGILANIRVASYPEGDFSSFLEQCLHPLARSVGARFGVILVDDYVDLDLGFEALSSARIPVRAEGYYLTHAFLDRIGIEKVREVHAELVRRRSAALRSAGLPEKASPDEIVDARAYISPKPLLIEDSDGTVFLYGLATERNYFRRLKVVDRVDAARPRA